MEQGPLPFYFDEQTVGSIKTVGQDQITQRPQTRILSGERADSWQFHTPCTRLCFAEMTELWCVELLAGVRNRIKAKQPGTSGQGLTKITAVGIMGEIKGRLCRSCN